MRILAALLILTSAILSLLLGGFLMVSSKYEKFDAKVKAEDDLSSVAGDLVSEEELEQMRRQEQAKLKQNTEITHAGSLPMILAVVAICAGILQIIAGALILLRRARIAALLLILLSLGALVAILIIDTAVTIGVIAAVATAGALCCHAPALRGSAAA